MVLRDVRLIVLDRRRGALVSPGDLSIGNNAEHADDCRTDYPVNRIFHTFAPAVGVAQQLKDSHKVKAPPEQGMTAGQGVEGQNVGQPLSTR